ncbi:MAG: hypothetical protein L6R38_007067 [Xanthoria sp. 2 TBL-2021]|nr:MAG: hypothetical protein L6R38_007067 [Xanthoria sp. 2 TBL-2021]
MELPSNHSRLPRLMQNSYGSFNEDLHSSAERSIAEKSARPSPCWGAEETAHSSYPPNAQNSCLYAGLSNIEGGSNHWNALQYSFGYPTPQSESPLSPPQQAYAEFPSLSFQETPERSGPYLASDLPGVQEDFEGLSPFGRHFSHKLRLPSPGESQYLHGLDEDDQQNDEVDEEGSVNSEPYAQLIFRALKSAPGHKMVLKDIYQWFEKHTNKARGGSKGWQNSIRHNLSMNGGFKKVDQDLPTDEAKRGFIWVLEPSALADGVKSTTRYRKSGSNKRIAKAGYPAPERQRSGARGGKAARNAAKIRRSTKIDPSRTWNPEDIPLQSIETPLSNLANPPSTPSSLWTPDGIGSFFGSDSPSLTPSSTGHSMYSYGDISGVTGVIPNGPLFADECESIDTNDLMAFHSSYIPDNGMGTSSSYKQEQIQSTVP